MTHRVFVYGTLKRGYPNNPLLEGSEFLGEAVTVLTYKAVTVPTYKMVGTSFPVIMPDPSGKPVAGEISALTTPRWRGSTSWSARGARTTA